MANNYSTSDVVKAVLHRSGELTDGTSPYQQLALKYVNTAYSDILKGGSIFGPEIREVWAWARQTGSFKLPANVTGNATLTNGSTSGTFSVAPTISLANYNFVITNPSSQNTISWYKISSHTASSTSFALDFAYVEPSGTYAYNAVPLTVDLGRGILRLGDALRQYNTRVLEFGELPGDMGKIYFVEYGKFWELYPLELLRNDIPSRFTIDSYSDSSCVLRFNKYVSTAIRIDYTYISTQPLLTDSTASIPLIPFEDRSVLEFAASYYLLLDKKQFQDAENFKNLAAAQLISMKLNNQGQQKLGKTFGQLIPRLDDTAIPYWLIQQQ